MTSDGKQDPEILTRLPGWAATLLRLLEPYEERAEGD